VELFIWRGFFCGERSRMKRTVNYRPRNASPAFGNPARSDITSSDLRSFAALVHTRCALIVSGAASNIYQPEAMSWPLELSKRNFNVSTRFISRLSTLVQILDGLGRILLCQGCLKTLNCCQRFRHRPPLPLFSNLLIIQLP